MATGGDVPGKMGNLDKDSDGNLNFLCSVCKKENKKTEAVKYCVTCEDYYCTECVKFHYKVPAMSRHVIVGKSDFKGTDGGSELPSIPTERCAAHPANAVIMNCKTHDRVGCATCMATTHGESCTRSEQSSALNKELVAAKDILQKTTRVNSESNNKSQQITCSNLAAMTTQKCEDTNRSLVCPDVKEIPFRPHVTCEELFNTLLNHNSLGEYSSLPSRKQSVCVPYKIVKKVETSVKVKSDKEVSWISGSCTIDDGTILLADINNKCLKRLLPRDKSVSDCLQLPDRPWSVAVINQREAAVTLPDQKQVQIIALDTTMKTTRTLKLGFECRGITHYNNELFISVWTTVYVYTVAGKFLRHFSWDTTGHSLFSDVHNMAVSESGRVLFVADDDNDLIAVERESGRLLWCYKEDNLVYASGVCVDGRGGVFVCGCNSHNVLQVSESGEKIGEIVKRADDIVCPMSVCFVTDTSTLVVTQAGNDVVMLYQVTT